MSQNPYEPSTTTTAASRTRPTRWMITTGSLLLGLALCCFFATVLMMMLSFDAIASSTTAPKPSDLASGISTAMVPAVAAVPLGVAGLAFLIFGFLRRQSVSSA